MRVQKVISGRNDTFVTGMKIKLHLVNETFGHDQALNSDLLLRVDRDRIAFAVMDSGHQLQVLSEVLSGPEDLQAVIAAHPFLSFRYRTIRTSINTSKFTFIPAEVYTESEFREYARFIQPEQSSDLVLTDLNWFGIRNLAALNTDLQQQVRSFFPDAKVTSHIDPFLKGVHRLTAGGETAWHFNFCHGCFEAALIRNRDLAFCNVFHSAGPEEFNYFLLLLLKQFPESRMAKVVISGSAGTDDPFHNRLKKYFQDIEIADLSWVVRSETFYPVPLHHYFSLLNLALCE
jgi:hypothetical protein